MQNKLISILNWLILLILAGCSNKLPYAEEVPAQERTVMFNLDIKTRAIEEPDKSPDDLQLWIFNGDNLLKYISSDPEWEEVYENGVDLMTKVQTEFELTGETTVKFYLVLNKPVAEPYGMTPTSLESIYFTLPELPYTHDNKVPMTGKAEIEITADQLNYDIKIDAVRSVGKLEVYCTRESERSDLKINKLTLNHIPDKGYLFEQSDANGINYDGSEVLFYQKQGMDIKTVLTEDETGAGSTFENYEEQFTMFSFNQPYLLENRKGGDNNTAIVGNGNGDDNVTPDKDSRYYITIEYVLNGKEESKNIYLPAIPRNTLDKLFIRIKDNGNSVQLHWYVKEWEDGGTLDIDGGMHPTTTFTDYNVSSDKGATDQNTWYATNIDSSTPDLMTNAARYTFKMSTNHEWNMTCSNIIDFDYKIFKQKDDGSYIDIENIQQQPVRAKGTYAICVYPRNPLDNPAQQCAISFSYYNTYMQKWEKLPDETAKATITQISAKTINDEGL